MFRKTLAALGITLLCLTTVGFAADTTTTQEQQEEIDKLQQEVKDLKKRVSKNEMKTGLDRINFTGDFRFQVSLLPRGAGTAPGARQEVCYTLVAVDVAQGREVARSPLVYRWESLLPSSEAQA